MALLSATMRIAVMSLLVGGVAASVMTAVSDLIYGERAPLENVQTFIGAAKYHGLDKCFSPLSHECDALYRTLGSYNKNQNAIVIEGIRELKQHTADASARLEPIIQYSSATSAAAAEALNNRWYSLFTTTTREPLMTWVCIIAFVSWLVQTVKTCFATRMMIAIMLVGISVACVMTVLCVALTYWLGAIGIITAAFLFARVDVYAEANRFAKHEQVQSAIAHLMVRLIRPRKMRGVSALAREEVLAAAGHVEEETGGTVEPAATHIPDRALPRPAFAPQQSLPLASAPPSSPSVYLQGAPIRASPVVQTDREGEPEFDEDTVIARMMIEARKKAAAARKLGY